jgi:hypothetical protein
MLAQQGPLLVGRQRGHAPLRVRIRKRREDPAADAEIGMPVVSLFHGLLESQRDAAKTSGGHRTMAVYIVAGRGKPIEPPVRL